MDSHTIEKVKDWQKKIQVETPFKKTEVESVLNALFIEQKFDIEKVLELVGQDMEKKIHEEKKIFEQYRDKAEKLYQAVQQI